MNRRRHANLSAVLRATALLLALWPCGAAQAIERKAATAPADSDQTYATRYYVIHGTVTTEGLREIELRTTLLHTLYGEATGWPDLLLASGPLPFHLFAEERDYLKAGGPGESVGFFDGAKLMAIAGAELTDETWHVIQHEAFHPFAIACAGDELPIWINEGLAEYFGHAIFTGDGYMAGIVPNWRLQRVKAALRAGEYPPLPRLLALSAADWNEQSHLRNYDQAWSMTHFLLHGDDGRWARAFREYLAALARRTPAEAAWNRHFPAPDQIERAWAKFWEALPEDSSLTLQATATVRTLTAAMARAAATGRKIESLDAFTEAAFAGALPQRDEQWIPPTVVRRALAEANVMAGSGHVVFVDGQSVRCILSNGTMLRGTCKIRRGRVVGVDVEASAPP